MCLAFHAFNKIFQKYFCLSRNVLYTRYDSAIFRCDWSIFDHAIVCIDTLQGTNITLLHIRHIIFFGGGGGYF